MKITDFVTITELARITGKSRPTLYKYISDFEAEKFEELPAVVLKLFQGISSGDFSKKELYSYCETYFMGEDDLSEIFSLIKQYKNKLNLAKLKEYILREVM